MVFSFSGNKSLLSSYVRFFIETFGCELCQRGILNTLLINVIIFIVIIFFKN